MSLRKKAVPSLTIPNIAFYVAEDKLVVVQDKRFHTIKLQFIFNIEQDQTMPIPP